jgi:hypothetical protein
MTKIVKIRVRYQVSSEEKVSVTSKEVKRKRHQSQAKKRIGEKK